MARARGCDFRAVFAGVIICWAVADGVAVAQESAEVTEDLGNSYLLARRTTSQGSIIETLLFSGQAIVTEIVVPGPDTGVAAGTTGAAPAARMGSASAAKADTANLPPGLGPGFGGTWLSGETSDDYLILHRTRASGPVTHEVFHDGNKVGFVTEVGSSVGGGRSGRNSFAFESTDDRFVVHLTQPDGTRIRAITEHGRFSGQVVERAAAIAATPRSAPLPVAAIGATAIQQREPLFEPVKPLVGRIPLPPQRLARPHEPADRHILEVPAPQISELPQAVPLPRPYPKPVLRPVAAATPLQTASPSPSGLHRNAPAATTAAPPAKPNPTVAAVNSQAPGAAAARPVAQAAMRKPTAAARPTAPAAATAAPVAKPKPTVATVSAQPAAAAKSVAQAKPLRMPAPGTSNP